MAEENKNYETKPEEVETTSRGMFDFLGGGKKKEDDDQKVATEFEQKLNVSEPVHVAAEPAHVAAEPEHRYDVPQAVHKIDEPLHTVQPPVVVHKVEDSEEKKPGLFEKLRRSDSSSSSSSEEEGPDGEKRKKKKKEKVDTSVPIEKCDETVAPEEKKGFLEKIKDKLPGKKSADDHVTAHHAPPPIADHGELHDDSAKEKKGIFEKIKEKIPGYHPKTEEEKEKLGKEGHN